MGGRERLVQFPPPTQTGKQTEARPTTLIFSVQGRYASFIVLL